MYAARPPVECRLDHRRVVHAREDRDLHVRIALPDSLEHRQAVDPGHPDVEQHEVWPGLSDERDHLRAGVHLGHDLDLLVRFERNPDRVKHQPMVIGNQNLEPPHGHPLLINPI